MNINLELDEEFLKAILEIQTKNFIKRFLESYALPEELQQELKKEIAIRCLRVLREEIQTKDFSEKVLKKFSRRLINEQIDNCITRELKED